MKKNFKNILSLRKVFLRIKKLLALFWKKISYLGREIKTQFFQRYKKSLSFRRVVFFIVFLFFLGLINFLINKITIPVPLEGGIYTEGLLEQPQFLNPVFYKSSSDFDIGSLIFSSLLKEKNGRLEGDLAESWQISSDRKTYTVYLKNNIFWHDGEKVSSEDIVFTVEVIKNPNYEGIWKNKFNNVEVKKVNEREIQFILKEPYYNFLKNLTFGVLPKHLLGKMEFPKLLTSSFNLNPTGSGPYKFVKSEVSPYGIIQSITLQVNEKWHFKKPFVKTIVFKFYPDAESLIEAYKRKEILGICFISHQTIKEAEKLPTFHLQKIPLPRFVGVFFNLSHKDKFFSSLKVREALFYALDRDKILKEVSLAPEDKENFFLFDFLLGDEIEGIQYSYDPSKAKEILAKEGFADNDNDGILEKNGKKLSFKIAIPEDLLIFSMTEKIEEMWKEIGVGVESEIFDSQTLPQIISQGAYEILIFGVNLDRSFDPYFWWHSSQCGVLNLSCFEDKNLDKILRDSQKIFDEKKRKENYKVVFEILKKNLPVIPLARVNLFYGTSKKVRGNEIEKISFPYQRFSNIENWYLHYMRILKEK